jgi:death-on-curing protein
MDRILEPLRNEYQRWASQLKDNVILPTNAVSTDDVLRAHFLLCDYFIRKGESIALVGPRDANLLCSAVSRQSVGLGNQLKWSTGHELTATLFYGLVKNHPFHDGNKRTALLVALYHTVVTGRIPDAPQKDYEELVVFTAANELDRYKAFAKFQRQHKDVTDARVFFLSDWFRRKTRRSDDRFYAITYNELETLLHRFGFRLANPSGNYIDIVRDEVESYGLFGLKKRVVQKRIAQVGYPGGTREVGKKAIGTIRRACGLTSDNGIDSRVFYKDADPLATLIARYDGPLRRLKDK